jgi:hypothetical protein
VALIPGSLRRLVPAVKGGSAYFSVVARFPGPNLHCGPYIIGPTTAGTRR